ncbi:MAG: fused MFS/spermidine synthase [Melioribacteraceae bacterium]|nr:fused MFS/spermidine synthase [Melioribacteraceae bacterium]
MKTSDRSLTKTIIALFFVMTGATGLVYQIVWFKYLALFLGNTTYAQMIVLSTFLGGLALGNYFFGRKADYYKNHLMAYAILELFIGLYCILYPFITSFWGDVFISTASNYNYDGRNFVFNFLRFVSSATLLLLPTIAMGGTLPILSKYFVENLNNTRKDVATLYFLNSFGAVWGILIAGFQLIPGFGLQPTIIAAAIVNIFVGLFALLISKFNTATDKLLDEKSDELIIEETETAQSGDSSLIGTILIIAAGLSGMAALLYEMVWTRLFITIFGSSTYAFSLMLIAFISGITIGSFLITLKFFMRFNKIKMVALLQVLIATSTGLILIFYERFAYILWQLASLFTKNDTTFSLFLVVQFSLCFLVLVIPTIFMGMTLPAIVDIIAAKNRLIGKTVGTVFSVNTLGTVAGVVLTGLVFIPMFGIKSTFEIGIAINLFAAIIITMSYKSIMIQKKIGYVISAVAIYILYVFMSPAWDVNISIGGVFRALKEDAPPSYADYKNYVANYKVLFYKEGTNANVAVTLTPPPLIQKRLVINGKPDASSVTDMPTQKLIAQIPMILHENPKNVFVVGFGSGATIGSVLTHPINKVDCAEISVEVIEAGKYFKEENGDCLNNDKLNLYNEDALTLLKLSKEKYDVIISEPSNPWIAGIGNLFSVEYFNLCKSKLADNGIMVQWFHMYESDDQIVKLVLNTFRSVFPNSTVWQGVSTDLIIVGFKNQFTPNFTNIDKKINIPSVKKDLASIGVNNTLTLLTSQSLSRRGIFLAADAKEINSEFHPRLEFLAPKSFYVGNTSQLIYKFDEKFDTLNKNLFIFDFVRSAKPSAKDIYETALYHNTTTKNLRLTFGLSKYLLDNNFNNYEVQKLYTDVYKALQIDDPRKYHYKEIIEQYPDSFYLRREYLNMTMLEKINQTNFLQIQSVKKDADDFIKYSAKDAPTQAKLLIKLASNYLLNNELNEAKATCLKISELLVANPNLKKQIPLEEFHYTNALVSLYLDDPQTTFENYYALIQENSAFDKLPLLRRIVEWKLREANQLLKVDVK